MTIYREFENNEKTMQELVKEVVKRYIMLQYCNFATIGIKSNKQGIQALIYTNVEEVKNMVGVNRGALLEFNNYQTLSENLTYKVAIYLRLSRDDESVRRFRKYY